LQLETDRLILKILNRSHADEVLEFLIRNRDFLAPWETIRDEEYFTREAQQEILTQSTQSRHQGLLLPLWIYVKNPGAKELSSNAPIIGNINFSNIIRGPFLSCFLGYKLDKDYQSQGFMTEALETAISYVFSELKLHRIEANVMPRNAASIRVLEKLSFHREGLALDYLNINGQWEDHLHYAKINYEL
jgi:ribosomal-protein-alanine N-acetyltransferase